MTAAPHDHGVPFGEAVRVWTRVAALSFGGPAGQIAVMHRIVVDEKRWIGEARFLHALNYCMLLPGPEAHQLAIYLGWLMHGVRGGLVAGTLFVLPGFVLLLGLSMLYALHGGAGALAGLFFGLKAAVLAVVLQAVARIGQRALGNRAQKATALAAFLALFVLDAPFPLVVLGAGLIGWAATRAGSTSFRPGGHGAAARGLSDADSRLGSWSPEAGGLAALRAPLILLVLWLAPVAALALALGPDNVFARLGVFFSQMAMVSFGGAYAVLAYVAQQAVETYHWLAPGEMLDGLGLAETTPGPLIIVVEFVGFLAAFRNAGSLDPWVAGALGATLTVWVTFLPSFLWIFLGAPHVERLRGNAALAGALSAIGAAVVGVILNLAVWFALHFVFTQVTRWSGFGLSLDLPDPGSLDPAALALSLGAVAAAFWLRLSLGWLLGLWAGLGLAWWAMGGLA